MMVQAQFKAQSKRWRNCGSWLSQKQVANSTADNMMLSIMGQNTVVPLDFLLKRTTGINSSLPLKLLKSIKTKKKKYAIIIFKTMHYFHEKHILVSGKFLIPPILFIWHHQIHTFTLPWYLKERPISDNDIKVYFWLQSHPAELYNNFLPKWSKW